jgi:hypothetical protein
MSDDPRLSQQVSNVVAEFIATQAEDGYLGPFPKNVRLKKDWDLWGHSTPSKRCCFGTNIAAIPPRSPPRAGPVISSAILFSIPANAWWMSVIPR